MCVRETDRQRDSEGSVKTFLKKFYLFLFIFGCAGSSLLHGARKANGATTVENSMEGLQKIKNRIPMCCGLNCDSLQPQLCRLKP